MTHRVFISYGHDEHAAVAEALQQSLQALGFETWYDRDRLQPGADWEAWISEGLEWAAEKQGTGCVLLLMTPHSVRRPGGYCLNELSRAIQRGLPIVPVMVSTCEAPLSICRLQWFDLRDSLPVAGQRERFDDAVHRLAAFLRAGQVPPDGMHARLVQRLAPIPFEAEVQPHLRRFTGRRWLLDRFAAWLRTPGERIFWITGGPGTGKSAIASWLASRCPEVRAVHFCRAGHAEKSDPRRAIMSMAHQLSTTLPDYRARLNALDLERLTAEGNAATLLDALFVQPLSDCPPPPDVPAVLLVDALDEAGTAERNELAEALGAESDRLPPWLRLCLTSRPEPAVTHALQGVTPVDLDAAAPANRDDLVEYLVAELPAALGGHAPSSAVLEAILDRSDGLFLYAEWIRRELAAGRLSPDRLDEFPQGLGGIYSQFFRRQFGDLVAWRSGARPFVEVLLAAREPLTRTHLAATFGWSTYQVAEMLAQVGSLFPERHGLVGVFHKSAADWLTDDRRAGAWLVEPAGGHRRLADAGWAAYRKGVGEMLPYNVAYLASHLHAVGSERTDDLRTLLLDPAWMHARLAQGGGAALTADIARLKTEAAVRLVLGALRLSMHVLAVDETQLPSQLTGRLLGRTEPAVRRLVDSLPAIADGTWLRPLTPGLIVAGGPLRATFQQRDTWVTAGAITRDGTRAIAGDWHGHLVLWNLDDGTATWDKQANGHAIEQVLLTPDDAHVVTVDLYGQVTVRDVRTGEPLPTPVGAVSAPATAAERDQDLRMALAPDPEVEGTAQHIRQRRRAVSRTIVGRAPGGGVIFRQFAHVLVVSRLESGQRVAVAPNRTGGVDVADFAPDGTAIALGDEDGVVWFWDLQRPDPPRPLTRHRESVNAVVLDAGRGRVISGSMDGACHVTDLTGEVPAVELPGASPLTALAVAPHTGRLFCAYGGFEDSIVLWDVASATRLATLAGHTGSIDELAIDDAESRLASFSSDRTLRLWSLDEVWHERRPAHTRCAWALAISADGSCGASGSLDASLRTWDLETGTELASLVGHDAAVQCAAFSPGGSLLCSGSWDGTVRLWEPRTGAWRYTSTHHTDRVYGVALTDRTLLSASWDGTVRAVAVDDLRPDLVTREATGCETVAATADGMRAIAGTGRGTVIAWDLATRRELLRVDAHEGSVWTVAIAPDGHRAASAGFDKLVKVWNLDTGTLVATYPGLVDDIRAVAVTGDGRIGVFGASDANLVQLRDITTGRVLARFHAEGRVANCAITPDGTTVALGELSGRVHFLRLEPLTILAV